MDALTRALLLSWNFRLDVVVSLLVIGSVQIIGWYNLRRRGRARFANRWRLASYLGGLVLVAVALLSPVDVLGSQLFSIHMVQHLLLVMIAPPLLLLANPFPVVLWALPRDWRIRIGGWFRRGSPLYGALARLSNPGVTWLLFVTAYLGWHDPNLYNLALRSDIVHDLEHITFFGAAMLFWWKVIGAGPQVGRRLSVPLRAAFAISAVPPNMLTGVGLAFATEVIYKHYAQMPRLYGISAIDDQTLAGLIMWIPGSMMFILAAIILMGTMLGEDNSVGKKEQWAAGDNMAASGLRDQARQAEIQRLKELKSSRI